MPQTTHHSTRTERPRALIVTVQPQLQTDAEHGVACRELERLAHTLGLDVVGTEHQKRTDPSPATYVGSGRLRQIAQLTGGPGTPPSHGDDDEEAQAPEAPRAELDPPVELVLVQDTLSPRVHRALEHALGVEVLDRTGLILEIFERRARTHEAKLELEIARLHYELPRLRDDTSKRGRRGGGGRGERGDTVVAMGKERIRARIAQLEDELERRQAAGATRRERRRQQTFQVALVGYTNAGKSSLMRGLTGSEVLIEDQLFATLGTTARQLDPPASPPVVVADTVGFIRELPHELVASFRSTLREAAEADLVLLVMDASDPAWPDHLEVTRETLEAIGVEPRRVRLVFNKRDRLDAEAREAIAEAHPGARLVSAHQRTGLEALREVILEAQRDAMVEAELRVPFVAGALRAEIHDGARVLEERHDERGSILRVCARRADLARWRDAGAT